MATDKDPPCQSCTADPNYAIICSFFEKFSAKCGISHFNFLELQEMLEDTVEVRQPLADLHIKLLRKARKSCSADKWERVVTKFCHSYSKQDGWELERFGYKNSRIEVKLRLLKHLLEAQFDTNSKFKSDVNKLSATELRVEPLGRDQNGQTYWCQFDPSCNIRIYKEDPDDEESWDLIAQDRKGLVGLIDELSTGEGQKELDSILNEDSNSQEIDKPIVDTGQLSSGASPPELEGNLSQEVKQYSDSTNSSTEIVPSTVEAVINGESDSNSRHPDPILKKEVKAEISKGKLTSIQESKSVVEAKAQDKVEVEANEICSYKVPNLRINANTTPDQTNVPINESVAPEVEIVKKPRQQVEIVKIPRDEFNNPKENKDIFKKHRDEADIVKKSRDEVEIVKRSKDREEVDIIKKPGEEKEIEIVKKTRDGGQVEIVKKPREEVEIVKKPREVEITKKPREEVEITKKPREEVEITKKPREEVEILKKPREEVEITKKPREEVEMVKKPREVEIVKKPREKVEIVKKPDEVREKSAETAPFEEKAKERVKHNFPHEDKVKIASVVLTKVPSSKPGEKAEVVMKPVPLNIPVFDNRTKIDVKSSDNILSNRTDCSARSQNVKVPNNVGQDLSIKPVKKVIEVNVSDIGKVLSTVKSKSALPSSSISMKEEDRSSTVSSSSQNPDVFSSDKIGKIHNLVESVKNVGGVNRVSISKKVKGPPGSKLDEIFKFKRVHDPTTPTNLPPQSQPIPAYIGPGVKDSVFAHMKEGIGANEEKREVSITKVVSDKTQPQPERSFSRLEERLGEISQRLGMRQVELKPVKSTSAENMQAEDLTKPKQKQLDEPMEPSIKKIKLNKDPELSEAVEEPLMLVRGEGSGADCNTGNPMLSLNLLKSCNYASVIEPEFSEAIEEPVMFFFGEGSGVDCNTGNPELEKNTQSSEEKVLENEENSNDAGSEKSRKVWSIDTICSKVKEQNCENSSEDKFFFGPGSLKDSENINKPSCTKQEVLSNSKSLSKNDCDKSDACISDKTDECIPNKTDESSNDKIGECIGIKVGKPCNNKTGEPISDKSDDCTSEKTDEPVRDKTDEPVSDKTDEPVSDKTDVPVSDKTDVPVIDKTDVPVSDKTDEPASDQSDEPVDDKTVEPVTDKTAKTISDTTGLCTNGKADESISKKTDECISGKGDDCVIKQTDGGLNKITKNSNFEKPVDEAAESCDEVKSKTEISNKVDSSENINSKCSTQKSEQSSSNDAFKNSFSVKEEEKMVEDKINQDIINNEPRTSKKEKSSNTLKGDIKKEAADDIGDDKLKQSTETCLKIKSKDKIDVDTKLEVEMEKKTKKKNGPSDNAFTNDENCEQIKEEKEEELKPETEEDVKVTSKGKGSKKVKELVKEMEEGDSLIDNKEEKVIRGSKSRRNSKAEKDEGKKDSCEEIVEVRPPRRSAALIATQLSENIIKVRSKKPPPPTQAKGKNVKDNTSAKNQKVTKQVEVNKASKKQPAKGANKAKKSPVKRGGSRTSVQKEPSPVEDKPQDNIEDNEEESNKTMLGLNSFSFDVDPSGNVPMPVIPSKKRKMDKTQAGVENEEDGDDEEPLATKKKKFKGVSYGKKKKGKGGKSTPKKKVKQPVVCEEEEGPDKPEDNITTNKEIKENDDQPKQKKPSIKSRTLLGLTPQDLIGVDTGNAELSACGRSVRTSRRIAQIKIKEQEEERKMHEQTMKEINNAREREKEIKRNKSIELLFRETTQARGRHRFRTFRLRKDLKTPETKNQVVTKETTVKSKKKDKEVDVKTKKIKDKSYKPRGEVKEKESKTPSKRKSKSKLSDGDFTPHDQDSNDTLKKKKGRPKKKRDRLKYDHNNPWKSSSGSGTSEEENDDLEHYDMDEDDEEEDLRTKELKSDHEFSPESDLEADDDSGQPVRHARTALKGSVEDKVEDDDTACQKCGKSDHPEWILLCDKCDHGWHGSCLRPALMIVPEGDWFCPPCQHLQLVEKLKDTLRIFEKDSKRRENDELRRKRLAYVGISLSNVLPPPGTKVKFDDSSSSSVQSSRSDDSGSDSSSESSSYEDEPVYQLRVRRQTNQSYRFNDYDQLINSAIQDEMEAVAGAGNQGRGKDIENIVQAEKQEANGLEPSSKQEEGEEEGGDDWRPSIGIGHGGGRKKSRKLTNIDVSSADDQDSDEDFKGSSASSEEEESNSGYSSGSDYGRSKRKSQPVRRSTRARRSRMDKDFIDDDSEDSDAPKKKKSKRVWSESESSESDETWGRRKKKSAVKTPRRKKKSRFSDSESDPPPRRKSKNKKSKVRYGLSEDEDYGSRRTRGKKINYQESESDENTPQVVKTRRIIESDEEDDYNPEPTEVKKTILSDSEEEDESEEGDEDLDDKDDDRSSCSNESKENEKPVVEKSPDEKQKPERDEKVVSPPAKPQEDIKDSEAVNNNLNKPPQVTNPIPTNIVLKDKLVDVKAIQEEKDKDESDAEMFIGEVDEEEDELDDEQEEMDEDLDEKESCVKIKIPSPINPVENKPEVSLTVKPSDTLKSVKDSIVEEELNDELISVPGPIPKVVPVPVPESEVKESVKEVEKLGDKEEKKPDPPKVNTIRIVPQHKLMANPPPQLEVKSMMMRPRVGGPPGVGNFPGMRFPPRPHMMRGPPQYPSQYPSQYLPYYSHHFTEEYPAGYCPTPPVVPSQQMPSSASYPRPDEGEFGGLVSYFSSQHEDNLDS